jgi:hypothetical protein
MDNPVDGTDGKLGRGFMSADKLEEVDIGNGDMPRLAFLMDNPVDGTDGKLGRGFMSADKLEEVDIGNGDMPRIRFLIQSDRFIIIGNVCSFSMDPDSAVQPYSVMLSQAKRVYKLCFK